MNVAGATRGEEEGVNDELLARLTESHQLVVEKLLLAHGGLASEQLTTSTLMSSVLTPDHLHQLDVLVSPLGAVYNEPELTLLVLSSPGHDVVSLHPTDILITISLHISDVVHLNKITPGKYILHWKQDLHVVFLLGCHTDNLLSWIVLRLITPVKTLRTGRGGWW